MRSLCWDDVDYPINQPWLPGPPAIHCGIDIGCPPGTIIKAARSGVIETIETGIVGIHVDGGVQRDFYLHGYPLVVLNEHLDAGTPVIHSDTVQVDPRYPLTGPHLHFEVEDGYILPAAPPFASEHSLDPVPILLGVGLTGQTPDGYFYDAVYRLVRFLFDNQTSPGPGESTPVPVTAQDLLKAIQEVPAANNAEVLAAIAQLQASVNAQGTEIATIKAVTDQLAAIH